LIYFIYDVEDKKPYINEVGDWNGLLVGSIDESLMLYIKFPDCLIVPEKVAMAYKFANKYKGVISVREGMPQYGQIEKELLIPYKDKFKYTLTDEDKINACLFHKAAMHFLLNKYYYNKISISLATPKIFKNENWQSEHVLIEKKKIVSGEIDACQDWHETGILLHKRFGVHYSPEMEKQPIDL
jgi:hypothetical protein